MGCIFVLIVAGIGGLAGARLLGGSGAVTGLALGLAISGLIVSYLERD